MKAQTKILLVLAALALLSATASASSGTSLASNPAAAPGTMTGGRYVLVNQTQPVNGALTGGRYQLAGPSQTSADPASGCCCKSYLPCTVK
jgi:hypothetical protein